MPKLNSLIKDSVLIFIIRMLPSIANLWVVIFFSHQLEPSVYGKYQAFWVQLLVLTPIALFGLHNFITTYSATEIIKKFSLITKPQLASYLLLLIVLAAIFSGLQMGNISSGIVLPFLIFVIYVLSTIIESYLIVCKSYFFIFISNILHGILFVYIHYEFVNTSFSLNRLFSYLAIIGGLKLLLQMFKCFNVIDTMQQMHTTTESKNNGKLLLHLGIYDIIQVLSTYIDKFVITLLLSSTMSAIYYNGAQNIPFLPILLSAAGSAVLINTNKTSDEELKITLVKLMQQTGKMLSVVVFPLFAFLLFFNRELITTLLSEKYIASIPVFIASLFILPVRAFSFTTVLQKMHQGKTILNGALFELILASTIMYPLYLLFGLPGVAFSFVISTYIQAIYYLFASSKQLDTKWYLILPIKNWIIKMTISLVIFFFLHKIVITVNNNLESLVIGTATLVITILLMLAFEIKRSKI